MSRAQRRWSSAISPRSRRLAFPLVRRRRAPLPAGFFASPATGVFCEFDACPDAARRHPARRYPDEADSIAAGIVEAGFGAIEVPLNSPDPLASIELIARLFGDKVLVGAGTVMEAREVDEVAEAGAKLVVAPNADHAVIERAVKLGLLAVPGVATRPKRLRRSRRRVRLEAFSRRSAWP